VRFTLIDQQENSVERENVVKLLPLGDYPANFARPINEENRGMGYAKFMFHEALFLRRYLVDDTLFLQVEVGP